MYSLTQQEQLVVVIGIFSVILLVLETLFFSASLMERSLFFGGTIIGVSLIIIFFFIIQPMRSQGRKSPYDQYYTPRASSFRPTIIPPPKTVKKTVMKGSCEYCGKKELMGFTCSYCNNYFCAEHRLPEKHECLGIRR